MKTCHDLSYAGHPYIVTDITTNWLIYSQSLVLVALPTADRSLSAPPTTDNIQGDHMANYPQIELYIDGRWKRADGQPVINPADESVLATVPTATRADLDDALAAAEKGFAIWRKTSPAKRAQIILKAASLIRERVDDMAIAMTLEQGKPIDQARLEILRGCALIEWAAPEG